MVRSYGTRRKFAGKVFKHYNSHGTKKAANDEAKRLRKRGYKVRVTKVSGKYHSLPWVVWRRK